jgi:hypothetical protein
VTVEFYFAPKNALRPSPNQPAGVPQFAEVEVMWAVQPAKLVQDAFGSYIKSTYYCVEVVIINRSGYEFQVAGVGFTVPQLAQSTPGQNSTPTTNYSIVRGSVNQGQQMGLRNRSVALVRQLGLVMTGATSFFHAVNAQADFSKITNILSNPVAAGLEKMFPDRTIQYLENLDDLALRNDNKVRLSVANNHPIRTLVFLPKALLNLDKTKRDNPQQIELALGSIFVFGDTMQSVKSIRIYSSGAHTLKFP